MHMNFVGIVFLHCFLMENGSRNNTISVRYADPFGNIFRRSFLDKMLVAFWIYLGGLLAPLGFPGVGSPFVATWEYFWGTRVSQRVNLGIIL